MRMHTHTLHAHSAYACTHTEGGYNVRIKFKNLKDSSMFREERQNQKTETVSVVSRNWGVG